MELQEYRKDFLENVKALAAAEEDFEISAFVNVAVQKLLEAEEVENFESCYFDGIGKRQRKLRVDGYCFDDVDDTFKLLIADYRGREETETLIQTDAEKNFERLKFFVEEAVSGNIQKSIEESSPGFGLASELYRLKDKIRRYRLFLLTDALLSARVKDLPDSELNGIMVEYHVWDIARFHRVSESATGREDLDIDFREFSTDGIPCLEASEALGEYKAYLCVTPARLLADIYERYGSRLLEGNVRSFLSTKGKVNKGIRSTILSKPEMFFAFNNGIAATATDADILLTSAGLRLVRAKSLQIVNGGQTTASLALAKTKDKNDLNKIFVQMKLSVVTPESAETVIPEISRCANSQNKVSEADFFSNHPFHIRIEDISRRVWAPAVGGAQHETHWFYERARGQFINEQAKMTPAEKRKFLHQNPRAQLITKTDLAKYHNSWNGIPHIVSLGAQKNFKVFAEKISERWEQNDADFHEEFFRESIALAILFKFTEKMVKSQPWYQHGYRANIVSYSLANLSHLIENTGKNVTLDLRGIWNSQAVSNALTRQMEIISKAVFDVIVSPDLGYQNVTEWCKKERCWSNVKESAVPLLDGLLNELIDKDEKKSIYRSAKKQQKVDNGISSQIEVMEFGTERWKELRIWAEQHSLLNPDEKILLARLTEGKIPNEKQSRILLVLKEKMESEGCLIK